jgi:hypothetical protein
MPSSFFYTRFVSVSIASQPKVCTLSLSASEITKQVMKSSSSLDNGKFGVERSELEVAETLSSLNDMIFEQDPLQIITRSLPLYCNG